MPRGQDEDVEGRHQPPSVCADIREHEPVTEAEACPHREGLQRPLPDGDEPGLRALCDDTRGCSRSGYPFFSRWRRAYHSHRHPPCPASPDRLPRVVSLSATALMSVPCTRVGVLAPPIESSTPPNFTDTATWTSSRRYVSPFAHRASRLYEDHFVVFRVDEPWSPPHCAGYESGDGRQRGGVCAPRRRRPAVRARSRRTHRRSRGLLARRVQATRAAPLRRRGDPCPPEVGDPHIEAGPVLEASLVDHQAFRTPGPSLD